MFGERRHTVLDDGERLCMHRALLLLEFCLMTAAAILGGDDGGDDAAFMLNGIDIILVGLVAVETVDIRLRMGAVFPLMRQACR